MGRTHEPSERTTRNKRKSSDKAGKILPESEDVTHSCSELTSKMTSRQEVDRVTKRKTKVKGMKESAHYVSSVKKSISKSQEAMTSEENNGSTFEFSKRLIELAREKQAENRKRKRSESKSFSRKRKVSENGGSHDNNDLKQKRQKLSQSASSSEDFDSTFRRRLSYETKLLNDKKTVLNEKRWSTTASNLTLMDFEFSRRLTELSRKKQRSQHDEHAHCCRCVQSFECFWPRSNLQTIRRQGFF